MQWMLRTLWTDVVVRYRDEIEKGEMDEDMISSVNKLK